MDHEIINGQIVRDYVMKSYDNFLNYENHLRIALYGFEKKRYCILSESEG